MSSGGDTLKYDHILDTPNLTLAGHPGTPMLEQRWSPTDSLVVVCRLPGSRVRSGVDVDSLLVLAALAIDLAVLDVCFPLH